MFYIQTHWLIRIVALAQLETLCLNKNQLYLWEPLKWQIKITKPAFLSLKRNLKMRLVMTSGNDSLDYNDFTFNYDDLTFMHFASLLLSYRGHCYQSIFVNFTVYSKFLVMFYILSKLFPYLQSFGYNLPTLVSLLF